MDKVFASAEKRRRRELADFLRTRRAGIAPLQVGLPQSARKRTPGLRREDVAELAGLSVSWYSWLEQARDINVSDESLNSIANALQLNDDERHHLFCLAKSNTSVRGTEYSGEVDLPEINRVLESFAAHIPATATGKSRHSQACGAIPNRTSARTEANYFLFQTDPLPAINRSL